MPKVSSSHVEEVRHQRAAVSLSEVPPTVDALEYGENSSGCVIWISARAGTSCISRISTYLGITFYVRKVEMRPSSDDRLPLPSRELRTVDAHPRGRLSYTRQDTLVQPLLQKKSTLGSPSSTRP